MKNNLANSFIKPFKSVTKTFIIFDKKPDGSPRSYVNYRSINNFTIKNSYF